MKQKRHPAVARIEKARALLQAKKPKTGRAAWELLLGAKLLPSAWGHDLTRQFAGKGGSCHAPDRVAHALRMAMDPQGIERSERAARAIFRGLYGGSDPVTVIWSFASPSQVVRLYPVAWKQCLDSSRVRSDFRAGSKPKGLQPAWRCIAASQSRSPNLSKNNPLLHLVELWELGYGLVAVHRGSEREPRAVVLVAPHSTKSTRRPK